MFDSTPVPIYSTKGKGLKKQVMTVRRLWEKQPWGASKLLASLVEFERRQLQEPTDMFFHNLWELMAPREVMTSSSDEMPDGSDGSDDDM